MKRLLFSPVHRLLWPCYRVASSPLFKQFGPSDDRARNLRLISLGLSPSQLEGRHQLDPHRNAGFCGLDGLNQASDFPRVASDAETRVRQELQVLEEIESVSSNECAIAVLYGIDRISQHVSRVSDVANFILRCHPSPDWKRQAKKVFLRNSELMNELNTSKLLWKRLEATLRHHEAHRNLTERQLRVANLLAEDFVNHGMRLNRQDQELFNELKRIVEETGFELIDNADSACVHVQLEAKHLHASLPAAFVNHLMSTAPAGRNQQMEGEVTVRLSTQDVYSCLAMCRCRSVRKAVYMAWQEETSRSVFPHLQAMTKARHQMAQLLGRESYSAVAMNRMVKHPEQVNAYLRAMMQRTRKDAMVDVEVMRRVVCEARETEECAERVKRLEEWDIAFCGERQGYDSTEAAIMPYFSLGNCLIGLSSFLDTTFGVVLDVDDATYGAECLWGPGVVKLRVTESSAGGELVGFLYLDLFVRNHKFGGCSVFPLRFHCMSSQETGDMHLPAVALVCNFRPPRNFSEAVQLSSDDLFSLFHECGHAMSCIFSRTEFQHCAGSRTATDFCEVPSMLFENFLKDGRLVQRFARHNTSGRRLLPSEWKRVLKKRASLASFRTYSDLMIAMYDQMLHGPDPDPARALLQVKELYSLTGVPKYNSHYICDPEFSHVVDYGGAFYSYHLCRQIANAIFQCSFRNSALSREEGNRIIDTLFRDAGERDERSVIASLTGDRAQEILDFIGTQP